MDKNQQLTRRDVVKIAALLGFCTSVPLVAKAIGPGLPDRGERQSIFQASYPLIDPANNVMSTCAGCRGGCPVRAQREEGILAKIDGNPWSPRQLSDPEPLDLAHAATLRGATCARGQARVQNLHDPYRLVRALAREGERGSGAFQTVDAAEAIEKMLAGGQGRTSLRAFFDATRGAAPGLTESAEGQVVIALDPRHQDRAATVRAFLASFPGSRLILGHPAPELAAATAALLGPGWIAAPRFDRARATVAWGSDPIATGHDPVGTAFWLAEHRTAQSATPIAIDPRLSSSGAKAKLWVPVRPGGDRALAHWIAKLWVQAGWVPASAVPEEVLGRPDRQLEVRSGIGARTAARLAETMHEAGAGLAIAIGGGVGDQPDGLETAQAILRLAVLAGALEPGGAMEPRPDPSPAVHGPRALAQALSEGPAAVVLVGDAGVRDSPFFNEVARALADSKRIGLFVSVTTAMGPLAALADFVFPDVTEFERTGFVDRFDGRSVVLPVIAPIPEPMGAGARHGLEGLLDGVLQGAGSATDLAAAPWEAFAQVADDTTLTPEEHAILAASLEDRVPAEVLSAPGIAHLLSRGWAPPPSPTPAPSTPAWVPDDASQTEAEPPHGLALVTWREAFGGQPDSDAQSWGSRAIRQDNPLHIHPQQLHEIEGHHSDQMVVRAGATEAEGAHPQEGDGPPPAGAIARVKSTQGIRPDTVGLAVGYGQTVGFDGRLTIDGVAVPPAPRRCCGVAVGPLLTPGRRVALSWGPELPDPSIWDLLTPGGIAQLPSQERKHHEDL